MGASEAAKEYLAGFAAGVATVLAGHPFDTVKVKLQALNVVTNQKVQKNAFYCTRRILMEEGIRGFYKGASSSFVGLAIESSLFFGTYSHIKQLLQGGHKNEKPQLKVIIPSAAISGALISAVLSPTELVKCRMQVQGKDSIFSHYANPVDCLVKTLHGEGARGVFRGGFATLLRESIGNAVFFSVYEFTRHWMNLSVNQHITSGKKQSSILKDVVITILGGGLSGIAFWSVVLPLDVAKTIIQTSSDPYATQNPFVVLRSVYMKNGLVGCYAGLGPTLARAFPANAAAIVAWEFTAKMLGTRDSY